MHAGLGQWNSDAQDDEYDNWEEADWVQANRFVLAHQDAITSPSSNGSGGAQDGTWFQWRLGETEVQYADIFANFEESDSELRPTYVGCPGDYVGARGFEELLEQLAETGAQEEGHLLQLDPRYKLPADDQEYETAKWNLNRTERHGGQPPDWTLETYDEFVELETDGVHDISNTSAEHGSSAGVVRMGN